MVVTNDPRGGVVLGIVLIWSYAEFGSLAATARFVGGQRLFLDRESVQLPVGPVGEEQHAEVTVINRTGKPVRLIGFHTSCGCVVPSGIPCDVANGSSQPIQLTVRLRPRSDDDPGVSESASIFTNAPEQPLLTVSISGRVSKGERNSP